jgi:nucleotidyltransferase substrate binding protein (TIGR01987 family)
MLYLNVQHLRRCIETLDSSLTLYREASEGDIRQEVFRNAIVKGFELTQEVVFKLLRKALKAYGHSGKKLENLFVKDLIRLAAAHGLMELEAAERWFQYRDNRNDTAHDYGARFAEETLDLIAPFLADAQQLADTLEQKFGPEAQASAPQEEPAP